MPETVEAIFIKEITVVDPDSKSDVEVEIWKDPVTGGIFGIDASFLESLEINVIVSPFDRKVRLRLSSPG